MTRRHLSVALLVIAMIIGLFPMNVPKLYAIADGTLSLNLHSGQTQAWDSESRIVAVIAGSQGGKTSFGPWWLKREIDLRGQGDYIAATSTYDLFKLKMLPEIRNVFEHVLKIGRYWSGDKILELRDPETGQFWAKRADDPMYARIILRAASSPGGLESATAKGAWLDEFGQDEVPVDAYEAVIRRLTLYLGRILLTTTPYNLGWIKQQILDREGIDPDIEVVNFSSIANPSFPRKEYQRLKAIMPKWKFDMFHRGKLSRPPGMIFGDFVDKYREEGGHKVHPFEIPTTWPRWVGVDPGAVNTAKIWIAEDVENGIYYVYRESLEGGKSSKEHAQSAQQLAAMNHEHVVSYQVGQKSEEQQRLDWKEAGVMNVKEPPFHDVEAGLDKVIMLLRQFRLYIVDTCTGLLDELGTYRRKLEADGTISKVIKDKQRFHRIDGLRYVIVGVVKPDAPVPTGALVATARRNTQPPDPAKPTANDLHAMVSPVVRKKKS